MGPGGPASGVPAPEPAPVLVPEGGGVGLPVVPPLLELPSMPSVGLPVVPETGGAADATQAPATQLQPSRQAGLQGTPVLLPQAREKTQPTTNRRP